MTDPEAVREYKGAKTYRFDVDLVGKREADAAIAALEAERDAATALMEDFRGQMVEARKERDRAEDELSKLKRLAESLDGDRTLERIAELEQYIATSSSATLDEADAVIPLNEEQAEAFKALSESIKNEQSLRAEVARQRKMLELALDDLSESPLGPMSDAAREVILADLARRAKEENHD